MLGTEGYAIFAQVDMDSKGVLCGCSALRHVLAECVRSMLLAHITVPRHVMRGSRLEM